MNMYLLFSVNQKGKAKLWQHRWHRVVPSYDREKMWQKFYEKSRNIPAVWRIKKLKY